MAIHRINLTTVSFISRGPLGIFAVPDLDWVRQIGFGLFHTANNEPPVSYSGQYVSGRTLSGQYRGLMTGNLEIDVDAGGVFRAARSVPPAPVLDPGYTPPFDSQALAWIGAGLNSLYRSDARLIKRIMDEAGGFHAGEASTLSHVALPPTGQWQRGGIRPLAYGSLPAPESGEIVLAHGILKFRAGTPSDMVGIQAFGAPKHVPWVWCEAMLCYAHRALKLYCAGSQFPSHKFYVNGVPQWTIQQVAAPSDIQKVFESGKPVTTKVQFQMKLPLFDTVINDQSPRAEGETSRMPIQKQLYTVAAQQPKVVFPVAQATF